MTQYCNKTATIFTKNDSAMLEKKILIGVILLNNGKTDFINTE